MDKVALLLASDRAALFGETGAGRGVANTIIEKDFWVCWTLKRLIGLPENAAASLVFKGGTSLSKAFGIIATASAANISTRSSTPLAEARAAIAGSSANSLSFVATISLPQVLCGTPRSRQKL